MFIDVSKTSHDDLYRILIGAVVPRPIAWVSTISKEGTYNLAPFSFFNVVSASPPMLAFSVGLKSDPEDEHKGVPKDTLRNVRATGEFVVNIVSRHLADKMNQSSAEYPPEVSEFAHTGLTAAPSNMVAAPRVGESAINLECMLDRIIEFGTHPGAGNLVIGRIVCIHIDDSVYKQGKIDLDELQPLGRLSGIWYCTTNDRIQIPRPKL